MHAFINYSHLSFSLIFFVYPSLWLQFLTDSTRNRIGHKDLMTSNCQQLRQEYQSKCKIIHFDPSKCFISLLKINGSKT